MNKLPIFKQDYLDILYHNRNKEYGSYILRRRYNRNVIKSFVILCSILAVVIGIYLIESNQSISTYPKIGENIIPWEGIQLPPEDENIPIPATPPPIEKVEPPKLKTVKFDDPVIVDKQKIDDEKSITMPVKDVDIIGNKNIEGDTLVTDLSITTGKNEDTNNHNRDIVIPKRPDNDRPLISVQQMPEFPGGKEALRKFLMDHIKYPLAASEMGIQGQVLLQFVVNRNGKVEQISVRKLLGGGCTEEAIRVVKLMPDWKPGVQNGQNVDVYYMLPVYFQFNQ